MLRLSVTTIDSYRYWRDNEDVPVEELLARIRREPSEETRAQAVGKAFHKALENATLGTFDALQADGFTFLIECDAYLPIPDLREVKAEKVYLVNGHQIEVVGMVDTLDGRSVEDHKTTSKFDAERFADSYQWRFYLDMFGADFFRWNVFEIKDDGCDVIEVRAFHPLTQFRYPGMEADVQKMLAEVVGFIEAQAPELLREAA